MPSFRSTFSPANSSVLSAHDVAHSKQHKSISASDVLKALEMIEFADLVPPLQAELQRVFHLYIALTSDIEIHIRASVSRQLEREERKRRHCIRIRHYLYSPLRAQWWLGHQQD